MSIAEDLRPDDTSEDLADFIVHFNRRAKREFPRVGNEDHPTPWDLRHREINDKLDLWQLARVARG